MQLNPEQELALTDMTAYALKHCKRVDADDDGDDAPVMDSGQGFVPDMKALKAYVESTKIVTVPPFVFTGLAGTGKTTVVGHLISRLVDDHGFNPDRIAVVAYTGKAASVLNKKLGPDSKVRASTIHRLLYTMPIDAMAMIGKEIDKLEAKMVRLAPGSAALDAAKREREELLNKMQASKRSGLKFVTREPSEVAAEKSLIIVDEASMVDDEIADDLSATGVPVIYVGDPNQLPPVNKDFGVSLRKPNAKLTTIMRQAGDSGVVVLAHDILKARGMPRNVAGDLLGVSVDRNTNPLRFIPDAEHIPQFVCYYNNTRHHINRAVRKHVLKYEDYLPRIGESVMLDANIHERRLLRGDILTVEAIELEAHDDYGDNSLLNALGQASANPYRATAILVDMWGTKHPLTLALNDLMLSMNHELALNPYDKENSRRLSRIAFEAVPVMFPYAITAYKAQGSEWERVIVINEKMKGNNASSVYVPFLYTAVTRARDEVVVAG